MKKYRLKVNGKMFEVEVEKVEEVSGSIVKEASAPSVASSGSGEKINAPLQGKIFDIKVEVGTVVSEGDCVVVIEAMKMENEVLATSSGTVKEILVSKGDSVDVDQPLVVVE